MHDVIIIGGGVNGTGAATTGTAMGSAACRPTLGTCREPKTNGFRPTDGVRVGCVSSRSCSFLVSGAGLAALPRGRGPVRGRAVAAPGAS